MSWVVVWAAVPCHVTGCGWLLFPCAPYRRWAAGLDRLVLLQDSVWADDAKEPPTDVPILPQDTTSVTARSPASTPTRLHNGPREWALYRYRHTPLTVFVIVVPGDSTAQSALMSAWASALVRRLRLHFATHGAVDVLGSELPLIHHCPSVRLHAPPPSLPSVSKQFKRANRLRAVACVVIGEEEVQHNQVRVKDMCGVTDGDREVSVALQDMEQAVWRVVGDVHNTFVAQLE